MTEKYLSLSNNQQPQNKHKYHPIFSSSSWRFIPCLVASGAVQMAIDEWLLEQHLMGLHPPTLRFYTWSPVAISLGYNQHKFPKFWQGLYWQNQPIDIVRRPTGGRAVLHQGDLTYSVIISGLNGDRLQDYQTICEFLIQGWKRLGLELHYGLAGRNYINNANCFATATGADLVSVDGAKFIGSAQLRRGNAILQHGSMRLYPDVQLFEQVFGEMQTMVNLVKLPLLADKNILVDKNILLSTIIENLCAAAIECYGIKLISQPLSETEWQIIRSRVVS